MLNNVFKLSISREYLFYRVQGILRILFKLALFFMDQTKSRLNCATFEYQKLEKETVNLLRTV